MVAEIDGVALTLGDVERIRGYVDPAPGTSAAARFAVEAALARWDSAGELQIDAVPELIEAHRELLAGARTGGGSQREILLRAQAKLRSLASRARLTYGPCYPRSEAAPDPPA